MKRLILSVTSILFCALLSFAQIEEDMLEFEQFIKEQNKEFNDFVEQQNKEFADMLRKDWELFRLEFTTERPRKPEPVVPVLFDKNKTPDKPQEIIVSEVKPLPTIPVKPTPRPVIVEKEPDVVPQKPQAPASSSLAFSFYGLNCKVDDTLKNHSVLKGITEKDVANAWEHLCKANYKQTIDDCISLKTNYSLNDYGYLLLVKQVSELLCGSSNTNKVALMEMFILNQSGYKVKLARMGDELVLLFATNNIIYASTYFTLGDTKYHLFGKDRSKNKHSIYTYSKEFGNATNLVDMNISASQQFRGTKKTRELCAKAYPVKVNSNVDSGLISFYKDYPQCEFSVYVNAPVSEGLQQAILPDLAAAIKGKKESEAANILINFVQTAFDYKTDDEQFGYEKPFFVDELFYYPYSDCEDRSVLYHYLVKTLMGLDVVLLDYPQHIATAVRFNEDVRGDFVMINGRKYVICDPTYINAKIGNAMPQFKNVEVKVLRTK